MTSKKVPTVVQLTSIVDAGMRGVDADPTTPLCRAFRALMAEGKPIVSTALCYFSVSRESRWYWLGVFVLSAGRRIIFFPALDFDSQWIQSQLGVQRTFRVDHLSLERNRRRWHFTQHDVRNHIGGGVTHPIGSGGVLWFGMTVGRGSLRPLRRETRLASPVPPSDADRRLAELQPLLKAQKQQLVTLSGATEDFKSVHFACIIGSRQTPNYSGSDFMLPAGSPFLRTPLRKEPRGFAARRHRFDLDDSTSVQLVSMALQADLTVPISFTTRAR